jgi:hypothetical protein
VDPVFWDFTHVEGGTDPVTVTGTITFELNGAAVTPSVSFSFTLTAQPSQPFSIPVPFGSCSTIQNAALLRFARRLTDQSGAAVPCPIADPLETTCPGINEIEGHIRSDHGTAGLSYSASALRLIFRAMAPVIMVHGWQGHPARWGDSPSTATPCGVDPNRSRTSAGTRDGGFGFIDALVAAKVPFDCSIQLDEGGTVSKTSNQLQDKLLACGEGTSVGSAWQSPDANFLCPDGTAAKGILAQFGTKYAHVVTHSTGGLWARQMLKNVVSHPDSNGNHLFGIYSMTTFSPPSHGSVLADILNAARQAPLLGIVTTDIRFLAALGQNRKGSNDLTVPNATLLSDTVLGMPPGLPGKTAQFSVDGVQNSS